MRLENESKLSVVRALSGSGLFEAVVFVDNQLAEFGLLVPGLSSAAYASPAVGRSIAEGDHEEVAHVLHCEFALFCFWMRSLPETEVPRPVLLIAGPHRMPRPLASHPLPRPVVRGQKQVCVPEIGLQFRASLFFFFFFF